MTNAQLELDKLCCEIIFSWLPGGVGNIFTTRTRSVSYSRYFNSTCRHFRRRISQSMDTVGPIPVQIDILLMVFTFFYSIK